MNSPAKKGDCRSSVIPLESSPKSSPDVPAPYGADRRLLDFALAGTDWFWEMDEDLRFTYFSEEWTPGRRSEGQSDPSPAALPRQTEGTFSPA